MVLADPQHGDVAAASVTLELSWLPPVRTSGTSTGFHLTILGTQSFQLKAAAEGCQGSVLCKGPYNQAMNLYAPRMGRRLCWSSGFIPGIATLKADT